MKLKQIQYSAIRIGIASPREVQLWARQYSPNLPLRGKVTKPKTVNYRTLGPIWGGLFCERIFGPIKNFQCGCGHNRGFPLTRFCHNCNVKITSSKARRHRLGYIELASPVVHAWYLRGRLSYISTLLDVSTADLAGITYCIKTDKFVADFDHMPGEEWLDLFQTVMPFIPFAEKEVSLQHEKLLPFLRYVKNPVLHLPANLKREDRGKVRPQHRKRRVPAPGNLKRGDWKVIRVKPQHRKRRVPVPGALPMFSRLSPRVCWPGSRQVWAYHERTQNILVESRALINLKCPWPRITPYQEALPHNKGSHILSGRLQAASRQDKRWIEHYAVGGPCWAVTEPKSLDKAAQHHSSVVSLNRVETASPHQRSLILPETSLARWSRESEMQARVKALRPTPAWRSASQPGWRQVLPPKHCLPGPLKRFHGIYLCCFEESQNRVGLEVLPIQAQAAIRVQYKDNWRNRLARAGRLNIRDGAKPRSHSTIAGAGPAFLTRPALFGTRVLQTRYENKAQPCALPQLQPLAAKFNLEAEYLIWAASLLGRPRKGQLIAIQNRVKAMRSYGKMLYSFGFAGSLSCAGLEGLLARERQQNGWRPRKTPKEICRWALGPLLDWLSSGRFLTLSVRSKREKGAKLFWCNRDKGLIARERPFQPANGVRQDQFHSQETKSVAPFYSFANSWAELGGNSLVTIEKLETCRFRSRVLECLGLRVPTKRSKGFNKSRFSVLDLFPSDSYSIYSTLVSAAREARFLRKPRRDCLVSCKPRPRFFLTGGGWYTVKLYSVQPAYRRNGMFMEETVLPRVRHRWHVVKPKSPRPLRRPVLGKPGPETAPPRVRHRWHAVKPKSPRPLRRPVLGKPGPGTVPLKGTSVSFVLESFSPNRSIPKASWFDALKRFPTPKPGYRCGLSWAKLFTGPNYEHIINQRPVYLSRPSRALSRAKHVGLGPLRFVKHSTTAPRKRPVLCQPGLRAAWLSVERFYITRDKTSHWDCKGEFCLLLTGPFSPFGPFVDGVTKPGEASRKAGVGRNRLKEAFKALCRVNPDPKGRVELPSPLAVGGPTLLQTGSGFDAFGLSCRKENGKRQAIQPERTQTSIFPLVLKRLTHKTGGLAIQEMLSRLDLKETYKRLKIEEIPNLNTRIKLLERRQYLTRKQRAQFIRLIERRFRKARRLILIKNLCKSKIKPEWIVLSNLPVLPPDLRPVIEIRRDLVAVSDLNNLYQKVVSRNQLCVEIGSDLWLGETMSSVTFAHRLLQKAVDALIENGKGGSAPILAPNGKPLKSLSDILKGKKGRFRLNLLGKRVDYSGRSVIVVGPALRLQECGLPLEMVLILFQPFLIRQLIARKLAPEIVKAKWLIQRFEWAFSRTSRKHAPVPVAPVNLGRYRPVLFTERPLELEGNQLPLAVQSAIWEILHQTMRDHPVLLNRAPTLHRLGVQAFQPKLVDGRAILLHPLVCPSFNADFDGDQMAVHVPLSLEARAEAWNIMWARNNLLSPATGQPILVPSQDMVLGCYYLTALRTKPLGYQEGMPLKTAIVPAAKLEDHLALKVKPAKPAQDRPYPAPQGCCFSSFTGVLKAYYQSKLRLHTPVWVRASGPLECERGLEDPLEARVSLFGRHDLLFPTYQYSCHRTKRVSSQYVRTTPGRVFLNSAISRGSSSTNGYNPYPSPLV